MNKYLLTLTALSLAGGALAQSNSAALSKEPAAAETIEAAAPTIEALALHPTPAKQQITTPPEVLAPSPILPTAKVQVRKLTAADAARLAAAQRWEQTGVADALVGTGGAVEYPYGYSRPTITCAPLHVCSVALQDGEAATSVSIGDTVRWLLQTATAGAKPVIMIKPTQAGLSTNLVVTTDKGRIYYMHLVSNKTEYVPMMSWYDPAAMTRNLSAEAQASARQKAEFEATMAATVAADRKLSHF